MIAELLILLLGFPAIAYAPQRTTGEEKKPRRVWQAEITYEEHGKLAKPSSTCTEKEWSKKARAHFKLITSERVEEGSTWEDATVSFEDNLRDVQCDEKGPYLKTEHNASGGFFVKSQEELDRQMEADAESGKPTRRFLGLAGIQMHRHGNANHKPASTMR